MAHQIIKQPDGLLCVWSTVVDGFVITDATGQGLADYYAGEAAAQARFRVAKIVNAVIEDRAREVYYQFTLTYEQAQRLEQAREAGFPEGHPED